MLILGMTPPINNHNIIISRWRNGNWKPRAIGCYTKEGEKYRKHDSDFHDQMYKWSDGTWRVGQNDKDHGWVKSVGSAACPENIEQWQFFDRYSGLSV